MRNGRAPCARSREELISFAKQGRARPTQSEVKLRHALRAALPPKTRIRRQHVLWGHIADFYIPACHLDIEVDGSFHDTRKAYDDRRDDWLAEHGVAVLRVRNEDVLNRIDFVLIRIMRTLDALDRAGDHSGTTDPASTRGRRPKPPG